MLNIDIPAFQGMAPRVSPALLEPTQGVSVTGSCTSGELRPWRVPEFVEECAEDTQAIFLADTLEWLTWDEPVSVHPAVQSNDAFGRVYYTRESGGLYVASPLDDWEEFRVGVPKPIAAPTVTVTGSGSGDVEDRVYAYSYVNDWGEEGPLSDPSEFKEWQTGKTVTLSNFAAPPLGYKLIVTIRVYRLAVGDTGADWFLVDEIDAGDETFVDTVADIDLTDAASTQEYDLPQENARGLVPCGNGVFATFEGNEIAFSEPYLPYAWPDAFRLTVIGSVIALGVSTSTLVILTNKQPYYVYMAHGSASRLAPEDYGLYPLPEQTPCVSPRGVVSTEHGVIFPAPDGLRVLNGSGPSKLLTDNLVTNHEWLTLFDPLNISAAYYDNTYFGFIGSDGFALHMGTGVLTWTGIAVDASFADGLSLFVAHNGAINQWDSGTGLLTAKFKSKVFRFPKPVNFAALRVDSSFSEFMERVIKYFESIVSANKSIEREVLTLVDEETLGQSVAGDNLYDLPNISEDATRIHFRVWADGVLRYDRAIPFDGWDRLPAGFLAREWQLEVISPVHIKAVSMGTSVRSILGR